MSAQLLLRPRLLASAAIAAGLLSAGCGGDDTKTGAASAPKAGVPVAATGEIAAVDYPGVQHQHYRFGPLLIRPGQNPIVFRPTTQKPREAGVITRFHPDLIYTDGRKPAVDVLHLHHGVWEVPNGAFAAGEEKTITQFPRGFGYPYKPTDPWKVNYMLHNLTREPAKVYLTWDVDFVPAAAAATAAIKPVQALWLDVGKGTYPVFDAHRGWGKDGRYRFPEDARGAERRKIGDQQHFTAPANLTLVAAGGHVHPGGLWVDLRSTRGDRTKTIFRSEAEYYEPAGAVSWDASMTFTKPDWRVAVHKGDTLSVSAVYDTKRADWYEVMGIMDPVWFTFDPSVAGADPFATKVDWHGAVTHGHLAENDHHGGSGQPTLPDARTLVAGDPRASVQVAGFQYVQGDLTGSGKAGRPPTVKQGAALTFHNFDSTKGQNPALAIYHTITGCKAPCNKETGIAYPLADGRETFDSGELGFGPKGATAAENRDEWSTPKTLSPGDYTYFCRVHPFMRGAFRVLPR